MSKNLGRGFESLLPTDFDAGSVMTKEERIRLISVSEIEPDSEQPRKHFDKEKIEELADSIRVHGVLQPLIVTAGEHNMYSIVAGERRWRAAKVAGLKQVPCIVRSHQTIEKLEIALIENVQRVDLSPVEQALSIERLHEQFSMKYAEIAKKLGKAPTTINNIVRLLQLPKAALAALNEQKISEGHARAILSLKDFPAKQDALLDAILSKRLSVRQAEQFAIAAKDVRTTKEPAKRLIENTPETKRLEERLRAPVRLMRTAKGGRLEIRFSSEDQLEKLYKLLDVS